MIILFVFEKELLQVVQTVYRLQLVMYNSVHSKFLISLHQHLELNRRFFSVVFFINIIRPR